MNEPYIDTKRVNKLSKKMLKVMNGSNGVDAGAALGLLIANFMQTFGNDEFSDEGIDAIAGDAKAILLERRTPKSFQ